MALPKINNVPKYQTKIPSTDKQITFRPFLVAEQKILLMALESKDDNQILNSILNTLSACIEDDVKVTDFTVFDLEYLFTQIRSKSVGETSEVKLMCNNCEEYNDIVIKLDDISVNVDHKSKHIKLTDLYTVVMKYPNYEAIILDTNSDNPETATEALLKTVVMCLDELRTEDDIIKFKDETIESINEFIDNLNNAQMQLLIDFVQTMPRLRHNIDFVCTSCDTENKVTLEGLQDFF